MSEELDDGRECTELPEWEARPRAPKPQLVREELAVAQGSCTAICTGQDGRVIHVNESVLLRGEECE